MPLTTISSREFNQDTAAAKRAAGEGPVVITDRGAPAHVLLTYERYRELLGSHQSALDCLAAPMEAGQVEFEPVPVELGLMPANLG